MNLSGTDFERLRSTAATLCTKNHTKYLAEALQCTIATGDPVQALKLLHAMWSSPYATRTDQKSALNDVGKWLEQLLGRDPKASVEQVSTQIGWLRRLARYYEKEKATSSQDREGRTESNRGKAVANRPKLEFGERIDGIQKRRTDTQVETLPKFRKPATPVQPLCLPATFASAFLDFKKAREIRKLARARLKSGKPPKEAFLELVPVLAELKPLAKGLRCSTFQTEGLDTLFAEIEKRNNDIVPFYVVSVKIEEGMLLAAQITLKLPVAVESEAQNQ